MTAPDSPSNRHKRRTRVGVWGVFLGFVVIWLVFITAQLTQQALFAEIPDSTVTSCQAGLQALQQSLDRGRSSAEGGQDPDDALRLFRDGIASEWRGVEHVRTLCKIPRERAALDALERLRYAEEHAVRREAASLAALRKQVATTLEHLGRPQ